MKSYTLVSYGPQARAGFILGGKIYDLHDASEHSTDRSMLTLLADWSAAQTRIQSALEQAVAGALSGSPLSAQTLMAPLPLPGTIFCAGANYTDHVIERKSVV